MFHHPMRKTRAKRRKIFCAVSPQNSLPIGDRAAMAARALENQGRPAFGGPAECKSAIQLSASELQPKRMQPKNRGGATDAEKTYIANLCARRVSAVESAA